MLGLLGSGPALLQRVRRITEGQNRSLSSGEKIFMLINTLALALVMLISVHPPAAADEMLSARSPDVAIPPIYPSINKQRETITARSQDQFASDSVGPVGNERLVPSPAKEGIMKTHPSAVEYGQGIGEYDKRKPADREREQADRDRQQADRDRQQAEQDRQQAVRDRAQADLDRVQADQDRQQADRDRAHADQSRYQADQVNFQADKDRMRAAMARKQADEERYKADLNRRLAEQK